MPQTGHRRLDPKLPWRLSPDGTLYKQALSSRHMLRRRRGWAVETAVLHRAQTMGAQRVRIEDEETGATWETTIERFERHGYSFDHGWGNQTALDLHHWQRQSTAATNAQMALFAA